MKLLRIICGCFVLASGIAGCVTLDPRDQSLLEDHHVSGALYNKMLHSERLELADIVELSKRGLPDPFILHYLRSTYAVYQLSSSDVSDLTKAGVSKPVMDYLLATPSMYGPPRYPYYYDYPGYFGSYPYYNYPPPVVIGSPYFHHHW